MLYTVIIPEHAVAIIASGIFLRIQKAIKDVNFTMFIFNYSVDLLTHCILQHSLGFTLSVWLYQSHQYFSS